MRGIYDLEVVLKKNTVIVSLNTQLVHKNCTSCAFKKFKFQYLTSHAMILIHPSSQD